MKPSTRIAKWIFRGVVGIASLVLFNLVGGMFGMSVGLNAINAGIVGILGLPGFALVLVLQYLSL